MNLFYDFHLEFYHRSFDSCYFIGEKIQSKYYTGEYSSLYSVDMFSLFWDFVITPNQGMKLTAYSFIVDEIQRKIGTYE